MSDSKNDAGPILEPEPNEKTSIIEQFPEYRFIPTSIIPRGMILILISGALFCFFGGWSISEEWDYFIYHIKNNKHDFDFSFVFEEDFLVWFGFLLSIFGILLLIMGFVGRAKHRSLKKFADYLSGKRGVGRQKKMRIFVKNRKFGVLRKGLYKVFAPAEYDKLSWRGKNILDAEKDGRHFVIDVYGNELN